MTNYFHFGQVLSPSPVAPNSGDAIGKGNHRLVIMAPPYDMGALSNDAIRLSVRSSVCLSHTHSSRTVHIRAMVTIEH